MTNSAFATNRAFTNTFVNYRPEGFVAEQVCPNIRVSLDTVEYAERNTKEHYQADDALMGRFGEVPMKRASGDSKTVTLEDKAIDVGISLRDVENQIPGENARAEAAQDASDTVLLSHELLVNELFSNTSNYATSHAFVADSATDWANTSTDIPNAILDIASGMIVTPDTLILTPDVFKGVRKHKSVLQARYGGTSDYGVITPSQLGELLGLNVVVPTVWYDSTPKKKTASLKQPWKQAAVLLRSARTGQTPFAVNFDKGRRVSSRVDRIKTARGEYIVRAQWTKQPVIIGKMSAELIKNPLNS